jgi:hypothetical protein
MVAELLPVERDCGENGQTHLGMAASVLLGVSGKQTDICCGQQLFKRPTSSVLFALSQIMEKIGDMEVERQQVEEGNDKNHSTASVCSTKHYRTVYDKARQAMMDCVADSLILASVITAGT